MKKEYKTITVKLSNSDYEKLKILVKFKDMSINRYVNDLIDKDLELNKDKIKKYLSLQKYINEKINNHN